MKFFSATFTVLSISLYAAWTGCAGTPMPAPPVDPPPAPDPDWIMVEVPTPSSPGRLLIDAAAVAEGTRLFVLNLDNMRDARLLDPAADGSFDVMIEAGTVRLESIDEEGLRSDPLDLDNGAPVMPMLDCLRIPFHHDPSAGPLTIENRCTDAVGADITLRRTGAYGVSTMRIDLAAEETFDIDVTAMEDAPDDALFFQLDAPPTERRAVTLY